MLSSVLTEISVDTTVVGMKTVRGSVLVAQTVDTTEESCNSVFVIS
jgi:hypothetical protein